MFYCLGLVGMLPSSSLSSMRLLTVNQRGHSLFKSVIPTACDTSVMNEQYIIC